MSSCTRARPCRPFAASASIPSLSRPVPETAERRRHLRGEGLPASVGAIGEPSPVWRKHRAPFRGGSCSRTESVARASSRPFHHPRQAGASRRRQCGLVFAAYASRFSVGCHDPGTSRPCSGPGPAPRPCRLRASRKACGRPDSSMTRRSGRQCAFHPVSIRMVLIGTSRRHARHCASRHVEHPYIGVAVASNIDGEPVSIGREFGVTPVVWNCAEGRRACRCGPSTRSAVVRRDSRRGDRRGCPSATRRIAHFPGSHPISRHQCTRPAGPVVSSRWPSKGMANSASSCT